MRRYGLIGYPLTHSFSQRYFSEKFEREGIKDCVYDNFSLVSIDELAAVLADAELCGLNVTIPYKEQVLAFLDERSPVVAAIGACNCIRIDGGRLTGYNTDVVGFEQSLLPKLGSHHRRALILGTGGASKAVEYVLGKLGIDYRLVSRRPRPGTNELWYEQVDAALLSEYTVVVNTTPLGMYPHTEECPPLPYEAVGPEHYLFDLVYNPARTLFLQKGEERGAVVENGHAMLVIQAEESWRIWQGQARI
ncbi:shikimate dehydrogenase family protein [Puia dinghuensis]|uniref:Shikimate 5-dehydrogenase n=1 Tax=Puia dinghuensis TaxID=1792502 RepID=A0A8J2XUG4_9BACT|nr:shikimate dehydrogenase [Puia dinghuensis]GGB25740.1 shikimate 5-dehydrogenase [Puia dinghuensis]